MATNNSKLLNEILDHYDKDSCGSEELELLRELFQACEKVRPKLCRSANCCFTKVDSVSSKVFLFQLKLNLETFFVI